MCKISYSSHIANRKFLFFKLNTMTIAASTRTYQDRKNDSRND